MALRAAASVRLRRGPADSIARDCRYDLHGLLELVEDGCRPDLAARILAPLLDEARPC